MSDTDIPSKLDFGTKRMGRFSFAVEAIRKDPHLVQSIMKHMIPINVKYAPGRQSMYYLAICEEFDELEDDELVPEYLCQVTARGDALFQRLDYKRKVSQETKDEIMETIIKNNVNMEDFKAWVRTTQNASDEDFEDYNEDFLEILRIYVARRD